MMRPILLLTLLSLCSHVASSQQTAFPASWIGNWKGELQWFKTGSAAPQKVSMELRIHNTDSGRYTWQLIYGSVAADNRPYTLYTTDSARVHWVIDEQNGILLDQYWVGNKFCGAFTVMNNTIVNNYWIENNKLMVEFFSMNSKPITSSGLGTDESPSVDSYRIGSYQKAVLTRQ